MSLQLHPNEVNVRKLYLNHDNQDLLTLAETLGVAYVEAIKEQSRRQNLIYIATITPKEE
jgi:Holliday junction resolvasome RuvABC endonuclease subunit